MKDLFDYHIWLENDKAICRPISSEDYEGFSEIAFDQSIWKYTTSRLEASKDIRAYLEERAHLFQSRMRYGFAIIDKTDHSLAGSTSFGNISMNDSRIEIGWTWLATKYQRTGLNRSVKYLMLKCAFEHFGFERVEFKTDTLNLQSRNALLGIGAVEEGVLRSHTLMPGARRRDTLYFSILKPEWPNVLKTRFDQLEKESCQIDLTAN